MPDPTSNITYFHQDLFGIPFFATTKEDALHFIQQSVQEKKLLTIATPNPEQIVQASKDKTFQETLARFDLYLPDGQGIVLASYMLGKPLTQRITGIDVVSALLENLHAKDETALVIGGKDYTNGTEQVVPLTVRGAQVHWFKNFNKKDASHTAAALDWIKKHHPTYVFIALGAPHQENWIQEHRHELEKSNVRVAMVVGGAFDVLTNNIQRAPKLLQSLGLEWSWRLLQQPWRIRRQLRLVQFAHMVITIKNKALQRL